MSDDLDAIWRAACAAAAREGFVVRNRIADPVDPYASVPIVEEAEADAAVMVAAALRHLETAGYVLVPTEMTEEMRAAPTGIVALAPAGQRQVWSALLQARPRIPPAK